MPTSDGVIKGSDICSQAVVERILGDEAVTSVKIYNTLQSDNFSAGSAGWQIRRDTGSCEFQDATIRGSLNASDIDAGTLSVSYLAAGTMDISGNVTLASGTDIRTSNYSAGSAGWEIQGDGDAEFNNVTVRGTIYATAGTIGGLSITGNLTMGSGGVFRTASSGERIEITETNLDRITFYSGLAAEDDPGTMLVSSRSSNPLLQINGPQNSGDFPAYLELASYGAGGTDWGALLLSVENPVRLEGWTGGVTVYGGNAGSGSTLSATFYDGQIRAENGSASNPSSTFDDDPDTGMYRYDTNAIGWSVGGTAKMRLYGSYLVLDPGTSTGNAFIKANGAGSVSAPAYTFGNDADTGVYRAAANEIGLTAGGAEMFTGLNTTTDEVRILPAYANTASGDDTVGVTSTGLLRRQTSAAKYKQNIETANWLADVTLRPVEFDTRPPEGYGDDNEYVQRHLYGLIADEVAAALPDAGVYNDNGEIENYHDRAVLAVLAAKINRLETHCGV